MNPRPQRLHTWLTLIPVAEFERELPGRVLFLDTFVTIETRGPEDARQYRVRFEGREPMNTVVRYGLIFVWYGDDLQRPDRSFPVLYETPYDSQYITSQATIFHNTHVMDFVENGSDNLHFRAVHLWEYSRIYDHAVSHETITLKQDTKFRYGSCSTKRSIRLLSKVLPELELTQDYVYHGPGLAVVGATGSGTPRMHALVSLTPEGAYRTRVYVTMAIDPSTFPAWAERVFGWVSPNKALCDVLAGVMANFIKNEFDIDAIIWANRKHLDAPALLPSERHLGRVIEWGKTFYPRDFERTPPEPKPEDERRWQKVAPVRDITPGRVHRYRVGDEEIVIRTDAIGRLRVFDAFCPHQGAHLGHGGLIEDDCLRCPFHGLYFDADGRCLGPNLKNKSTFIEGLRLTQRPHRVRARHLEVFV